MRIEQLYYFLDVAQTQSITKSANNLFISPQGLSQAIAALEKEYEMELFERSKSGLVLNSHGSAFKRYAKDLCESYQRFEQQVASIAKETASAEREKLSLCLPPLIIWSDVLIPLVDDLSGKYPDIEFDITEKHLDDVIRRYRSGDEDFIGVATVPDFRVQDVSSVEGLCVDFVLEMPIIAKVHRDSPFAQKKFFSRKELSEVPLVCFNEPIIESIAYRMTEPYGEPHIVLKGSTNRLLDFRKEAVALSVGMAISSTEMSVLPIVDTITVRLAVMVSAAASKMTKDIASALRHFLLERYPLLHISQSAD